MCRLIETIQIENGIALHLDLHQHRMNKSYEQLFQTKNPFILQDIIKIPDEAMAGIWKYRIVYAQNIEEISITPYVYRNITSLRIIEAPHINYSLKYEDRNQIMALLQFKKDADDILITQHGYLTDTSYSNIALFDGEQWFTPNTYLLAGTQREHLLHTKQISERSIHISDLCKYSKARLINCFCDLHKGFDICIENIE